MKFKSEDKYDDQSKYIILLLRFFSSIEYTDNSGDEAEGHNF